MPEEPQARPGDPTVPRLLAGMVLVAALLLTGDYLVSKTLLGGNPLGVLRRLRDLAVLSCFLTSAWVVGERGLDWLDARIEQGPYRAALAIGVGLVPAYAVAMLLAVCQLVRPWTLGAAVILPFLVWPGRLKRLPDTLRTLRPEFSAPLPVIGLGVALVTLYGLVALLPPCWDDPLTYHLTIPKEYLIHGGVPSDHGNFYPRFPDGHVDALPVSHGPRIGPAAQAPQRRLPHLDRRDHPKAFQGPGRGRVAAWSILFFLGQWTVQHGVQRANVDFHFAFYGLAAFLLVTQLWAPSPELGVVGRWPVLLGLFLGAAVSGKIDALACVAATLPLLGVLLARRLANGRQLAVVAGVAVLVYVPTLVRNLVYSTDPVLFMAADRIGLSLPAPPEVAARLRALPEIKPLFMTRPDPLNFLLVPYFVYRYGAFPTTTFDAAIDPLYLLGVPLAWLLLRRQPFTWAVLLYLGGFYVAWMLTTPLTRYAMPALPLLAFLTVASLDAVASNLAGWAARVVRSGVFACVGAIVAGNLIHLTLSTGQLIAPGMTAFFELGDRLKFLHLTGAGSMVDVSRYLDSVEREKGLPHLGVYMVFASQAYYLDHPYVNDPFYVNLAVLRQGATEGKAPLDELRKRGFGWILIDVGRLPWLFGGRHGNPRLNPYPEGIRALKGYLQFWNTALEPHLEAVGRFGTYELYRIPPAS